VAEESWEIISMPHSQEAETELVVR
jgi:hypothetical protein